MISVRIENKDDIPKVHHINHEAFEAPVEADLVDKLRKACPDHLSLVAEEDKTLVGHILFTPAVIQNSGNDIHGMGLAPMAVLKEKQRQGIGSMLVQKGLKILREKGCPFVIVLGHPEYYPRFGFEPASRYHLKSQWEGVPDEAFMIIVFDPEALLHAGGVARYRDEFDEAM